MSCFTCSRADLWHQGAELHVLEICTVLLSQDYISSECRWGGDIPECPTLREASFTHSSRMARKLLPLFAHCIRSSTQFISMPGGICFLIRESSQHYYLKELSRRALNAKRVSACMHSQNGEKAGREQGC